SLSLRFIDCNRCFKLMDALTNQPQNDRLGCRSLVKSYRKRVVVNDVSIHVNRGEIVGLLGPNGAGKTTTFYSIVRLIRPDSGSVFLNDADLSRIPMFKRARLGIGYLPQETSV